MKIENCHSFTDLVLAVANHGSSIQDAEKRCKRTKKCGSQIEVDGKSEYRFVLENYPHLEAIADKIAGI